MRGARNPVDTRTATRGCRDFPVAPTARSPKTRRSGTRESTSFECAGCRGSLGRGTALDLSLRWVRGDGQRRTARARRRTRVAHPRESTDPSVRSGTGGLPAVPAKAAHELPVKSSGVVAGTRRRRTPASRSGPTTHGPSFAIGRLEDLRTSRRSCAVTRPCRTDVKERADARAATDDVESRLNAAIEPCARAVPVRRLRFAGAGPNRARIARRKEAVPWKSFEAHARVIG